MEVMTGGGGFIERVLGWGLGWAREGGRGREGKRERSRDHASKRKSECTGEEGGSSICYSPLL